MDAKRLKYNKETNIIEVIEEESHVTESKVVQPKQRRETVNFIISILSFIISIGALGISYSQKVANDKQVDVSVRQFELDKKPVFECYIEQEELYSDDEYWQYYKEWLDKNEIKSFDEWYYHKFSNGNIFNEVDKRKFWDAYDNYDIEILTEITDGKFEILEDEYRKYLNSMPYISYSSWKESIYVFKKDNIILKNTGAHISNARLNVYTYINYKVHIGDDIFYSFVFDMVGHVPNACWEGKYSISANYDSGSNSFCIEYIQKVQNDKNEYLELANLLKFLSSNDILDEIGLGESDIKSYCVEVEPVYFSISYSDNEREEQTDWYRYYRESNTLDYVEIYDSKVEVPDITKDGISYKYFEAKSLCIAEMLGYQNAQRRDYLPWNGYTYIEEAKEKIIFDLKEFVNDM